MWKKYCRAGQATDDNMAHAHCMLDTYGYKNTLRICNTYYFSSATMVARTRLIVAFIHALPVLLILITCSIVAKNCVFWLRMLQSFNRMVFDQRHQNTWHVLPQIVLPLVLNVIESQHVTSQFSYRCRRLTFNQHRSVAVKYFPFPPILFIAVKHVPYFFS